MQTRRSFIRQTMLTGLLLGCGRFPLSELGAAGGIHQLSILHTNDTHSRLQPFEEDIAGIPKGSGGIAARAALIDEVRRETGQLLLLDAGDFLQGSPYYDLYKGVPEIRAMDLMYYDAVTLGEHDLYGGIDQLAGLLNKAGFASVCSNYRFSGTALEPVVKSYAILVKGGMKIGIMAVGPYLQGLVPEAIAGAIQIADPLITAQEMVEKLRRREHCDMIICLSRLGLTNYASARPDDKVLARETSGIDLIIGGRTHTFLEQPLRLKNKKGQEVLVVQSGWGGAHIGRLNYIFSDRKKILSVNAQTVILGK